MLESVTLGEILKKIIEGNDEIQDNSILGKCSKCGECCSNILPLTQSDFDRIVKYVVKNDIVPQKHMLVMRNRLACPYYDGKKCLIYEVRPIICREFYCYKQASKKIAETYQKEKFMTIDMWLIAEATENARKLLKKD